MAPQGNPSARQPPEYLVVGRVLRPHGVRGGLLVQETSELLLSLRPETEIYIGPSDQPETVASLRAHRKWFLLYLHGCSDRDAAERYRDSEIRIRLEAAEPLPEGVYYHWQILGLQVETEGGLALGEVSDILTTGANDVYVVKGESGAETLIPAIESVIKQVDLPSGRMVIHALPGLLPGK